jgi:hypothetical protein
MTALHPDVTIDLAEAHAKLATFGRALAKLDDLDLLDPGATRPDEENADDPARYRHATRCDSPVLWTGETPLAVAYTAALRAIHDCAMGLLALDELDDLPARDHPPISGHTLVVPIAEGRAMVARLLAVLGLVSYLDLPTQEQITVLRALEHVLGREQQVKRGEETVTVRLSALDLPLWKAIATAHADGPPPPKPCVNEPCPNRRRPRGVLCQACARYQQRYQRARPVTEVAA